MIGIYKITNLKNGKFYIGSSFNILRRWGEHCDLLEKKNHYNYKLQNAFDEFDKQKYSLCVIVGWICAVADIDKPINIYISSKRMRDILLNWLNGGEL